MTKLRIRKKIIFDRRGFSLIEIMVAMLILALVLGGMVAVAVAGINSYQKSRAIKTVAENVNFTLSLIAKDVRMGKTESGAASCYGSGASPTKCIMFKRNNGSKVCYRFFSTGLKLGMIENMADSATTCPADTDSSYKILIDFSNTGIAGIAFDTSTSGFRSQATDISASPKIRGWVEVNMNIENPTMSTDAIRVQTILSSRDYGL